MAKGYIHIITSPVKADIMINGEYRGSGDLNIELEEGTYQISFHPVTGYITPSPMNIAVNPGFTALITVEYIQHGP